MATPTIPNGEEYFYPVIYSGNGTGQRVGKFVPFTDSGTIANSCMFNNTGSGSAHYLRKASMSAGNQQVATFSAWIKFCGPFSESSDLYTNNGGILEQGNGNWTSGSHFMFYQNRGRLDFYHNGSSILRTNRHLQDSSKWYHIMFVLDVTQDAVADRLKIYIDGNEETDVTDNRSALTKDTNLTYINASGQELNLAGMPSGNGYQDTNCYLAEVNYIDGAALGPDTFGVTDTSTGRWIPKTLTGITYGTNGFRMQFGTDSALGDDTSGNNYDLTANNLTASDQRTDTPTNLFPTIKNYHPSYVQTLAEGNLRHSTTGSNKFYPVVSTLQPKGSGKFYAECKIGDTPGGYSIQVGCYAKEDLGGYAGGAAYFGNTGFGSGLWLESTYYIRYNNTTTSTVSFTFSADDVIGLALDLDNGLLSFYDDDNGLIGTTTFDKNKSACFGAVSNKAVTFDWNFGDNPTFSNTKTAGGNADEDGNGNFIKSVPSGFKVLKQDNMAETSKGISAFSWMKSRGTTYNHISFDSSQGVNVRLLPSATNTAVTAEDTLNKFLKGGSQIGSSVTLNAAGNSMVAWNWVANAGTTESISVGGDITIASTVQKNTTAGFSIVQYVGNGTAGAKVGHGLSQAPEWIITKRLDSANSWHGYHAAQGATKYFLLDSTTTFGTSALTWNNTAPDATTFTLGSGNTNNNTGQFVAYCWHPVEGFSKFGKYNGNGNANGPFIYTGFLPAWIMIKETNNTNDWPIWDNARFISNPTNNSLFANLSQGDNGSSIDLDVLSNGFKPRTTNSQINRSSGVYVYMAFAKNPFNGDGTSFVTAR